RCHHSLLAWPFALTPGLSIPPTFTRRNRWLNTPRISVVSWPRNRTQRIAIDPLVGLSKIANGESDLRHPRRDFSLDELAWLLDAAMKSPKKLPQGSGSTPPVLRSCRCCAKLAGPDHEPKNRSVGRYRDRWPAKRAKFPWPATGNFGRF